MASIEKKNNFFGFANKTKIFLNEVNIELKKVIWPDRKFVFSATLIVLAIVLLSSVYVLVVDFVLEKVFAFLGFILKGNI